MDANAVRSRYDDEMRADPPPEAGVRHERVGALVRSIGRHNWIGYSRLDARDVDSAIATEVAFFGEAGQSVEWKVYAHDQPPDLGRRLESAGFQPDPPETLLVCDLASSTFPYQAPQGIEIRPATNTDGLDDVVTASSAAFSRDESWIRSEFAGRLHDRGLALFVAYADGEPISSGRLEMPPKRSFASLWGGGTSPAYRRRGAYRALVAARARLAADRGFPYLTVDARESSRPILERLGFTPVVGVQGWVLNPTAPFRNGASSGP